jgi:hypothetical protein
MADTSKQLIAGVYSLLRRPSQVKLPYQDVRLAMNDLLRAYVRDLAMSEKEDRTELADATIIPNSNGIDYLLTIAGVPDFEPVKLEYGPVSYSGTRPWYEAVIADLDNFTRHLNKTDYVAAAFYASQSVAAGIKVKLNLTSTQLADYVFRIAYRVPLLTAIALTGELPIPQDFVTMFKLESALMLMPQVKDESDGWNRWVAATQPIYQAAVEGWKLRWQTYLAGKVETNSRFRRRIARVQQAGVM